MAARRHPGVIVHRLAWSMSYDRMVRCLHRSGDGRTTGKVVRLTTDRRREKALLRLKPGERTKSGASTVVAQFEDGGELAVDSIERVMLPVGDAGAAFAEGG